MQYEAEQNAGQAIYNRLHLQDERNRMTRIIAAYKKTQLVYCFIIHEHFVSMYCSFVFLYSSTLLHFAICKDSSNNRLQNIAILKLILIFIATLSTLLKVLHF